MGVLPMNAIDHNASTRPRIAGGVASCNVALAATRNVTDAPPSATSATISSALCGRHAHSEHQHAENAVTRSSKPRVTFIRAA